MLTPGSGKPLDAFGRTAVPVAPVTSFFTTPSSIWRRVSVTVAIARKLLMAFPRSGYADIPRVTGVARTGWPLWAGTRARLAASPRALQRARWSRELWERMSCRGRRVVPVLSGDVPAQDAAKQERGGAMTRI